MNDVIDLDIKVWIFSGILHVSAGHLKLQYSNDVFFDWKVEGESCFMDIVEFPEIIISVKKKISCGK